MPGSWTDGIAYGITVEQGLGWVRWLLLDIQWGLYLSGLLPGAWVAMDPVWSLGE